MKQFIAKLQRLAKQHPKRICFPEATEPRTIEAVKIILRKKIAKPILVGDQKEIAAALKKHHLSAEAVTIRDPKNDANFSRYLKQFLQIRKEHGLQEKEARQLLSEPIYFATMTLYSGNADGVISGAIHPTAHTLRPAFQIIKTHEKFHKASGVFFMVLRKKLLLFSDCSVNVAPDAKDLAEIALDTATTAHMLGLKPRVAMLSFSTYGSAQHHYVDKVREATAIVQAKNPKLLVGGEMQVDAALVPAVAAQKCPKSAVQGDANVLIFPNLDAGNIAYKLVERLAKANAIGPIIQGLNKPVNDLSRGCSVEDIVDVTAVTVMQAQEKLKYK
ncbi:phosphate acetyltransferase [Candidatus Woesearchaeota archaeon]|nr:phosphate acetyltransferase [Candidatus Woesearchaeota archaeon]